MTFDERYRAINARDTRFDGQFVTAVRTTGIYCRPSCPARTPKPQNVAFYLTSAAAQEAGYRACKRCLPEAVPGSPDWNLRGDVAARAMRLIAEGVVERSGVHGLAAQLGYSARHLTRVLGEELGAGPLALARAHRAQTARLLLVGTGMPIADVAFASGFASIRQFNDTMRTVFGTTPTLLRSRRAAESGAPAGEINLALAHRRPIDTASVFCWLAARAIPGVETATSHSYARTIHLPAGNGWFEVYESPAQQLRLRVRLTELRDLPLVVARARALFDLDADPTATDHALAAIPELADVVRANPGVRVPGTTDPHELLIRAMAGQQISVAAARTTLTRLVAELGEPFAAGDTDEADPPSGSTRLFPTMTAVAEHGAEVLRGPAQRVRALTGAAAALACGDLILSSGDDAPAQSRRLLELPGVGPWTAGYVRMRVLRDADVLLSGDAALRAGAARLGVPDTPNELDAWATRAAPWRSYLSARLWQAASLHPPLPRANDAHTNQGGHR